MSVSSRENHPGTAASEKSDDSRYLVFGRVAEEIDVCLRAGRQPDVEALVAQHPEMAEEIRQLVSAQVMLYELGHAPEEPATGTGPASSDASVPGQLGDYRILGEIGRGGMGVVYEAQQISLDRRVALKVLPFAAVLDPKHLQRFKNEARAAASLDHPNIVHVYSVGCERGVHYYAMQYIEGQTLAEVIGQLSGAGNQGPGVATTNATPSRGASGEGPEERVTGRRGDKVTTASATDSPPHPVTPSLPHDAETSPLAALSTEGATRTPEFFRTVAHLGVQAAEALEHAHGMGVVHRDIKPSNLMVDARGHLWITDFGLAMTHTETNLTMTGDVLGTLRYMSPEQVQAKHGVLDHRTDVYSLGLTLYELLTLQPAFPGDDRQKLLRQIPEDDPRSPRQVNNAIPRDLETIILKATAKEPQTRYATAQELADDMKRFLEDKPIQARRPSLAARSAKWSRRHRAGVTASIVATIVVSLAGAALFWHGQRQEARQRQRAEDNLRIAMEAVDRVYIEYAAENYLVFADQSQHRGVSPEGERFLKEAMRFYERFAEANRGEPSVRLKTANAYRRVGYIRSQLGMHAEAEQAWSDAVRGASKLVSQSPVTPQQRARTVDAYIVLGRVCHARGEYQEAIVHFRDAIHLDPKSDQAYYFRGTAYKQMGPLDRAIVDLDEAIRMNPNEQKYYAGRGDTYRLKGHFDKAISDCTKAIQLDPKWEEPYHVRALAYHRKGDLDRAIADYSKSIQLAPRNVNVYANRGRTYAEKGEFDKAIADWDHAIRMDPNYAYCYLQRGIGYFKRGEFDKAIADFDQAIRLAPPPGFQDLRARLYDRRAQAHREKGNLEQALADFKEAIRLDPTFRHKHTGRAYAYCAKDEFDKAIAECDQIIQIDPEFTLAYYYRGFAYSARGEFDKAIADFDRVIRLSRYDLYGLLGRGKTYFLQGEFHKAITDYNKAIRSHPNSPSGYSCRASVRAKLGEIEDALSDVAKAVELGGREPDENNSLAWFLVTCEDPRLRRVDRAVELASEAVKGSPWLGRYWATLGVAQYGAGNWEAAKEAMEKATERECYYGGTPWFFMAMACWQLGEKAEARRWYDKAIEWMEGHARDSKRVRRFRAEAEELMGIADKHHRDTEGTEQQIERGPNPTNPKSKIPKPK